MTDSPRDPELDELASAYLDGAATPDERARVEADPDLLAEVERLRQIRAVVSSSTEPAPLSVREAQISAALDVWDRLSDAERSGEVTPAAGLDAAAAAAITTPPSTSLDARRRRRRASATSAVPGGRVGTWVLGAAAALVVVAGGAAVFRALTDDADQDDADLVAAPAGTLAESEADITRDEAAEEFADAADDVAVPAEIDADDAADEDIRSSADGGEALDAPADAAAEAPVEAEAPAEAEATEAAEAAEPEFEPAEQGDVGADEQPPPAVEVDVPALFTSDELADFGAFAAYAGRDPTAPTTVVPATTLPTEPGLPTCDDRFDVDLIAGAATYDDIPVIVGVDLIDPFDPTLGGTVIAYDASCVEIARAPLPDPDEFFGRD